jgi:hypothetical protein
MLVLVRLPLRITGRLLAPLARWMLGQRSVLLFLAVLQALFRGAEGHLVPVVKQRPEKRSLVDIGKGAVRDASKEVAWSAAEIVLWIVRCVLEFLGICLPAGKYDVATGGTGGTGGTEGETTAADGEQSDEVPSDEVITSPGSLTLPAKDCVPIYDIDSDREGHPEFEAEDRLNFEKFRTAASVKQVERSELKIRDLHRQVSDYETTVEDLRDQVKTLTAELLALTPRAAGSLASGASSGAATPVPVARLPTQVMPPSLMAELNTKLRNRRDSEGSSVSAGTPGRKPVRRSDSFGSPPQPQKDPGAEYLKVLRPSPRSPQMQRWSGEDLNKSY